MTLFDLTCRVLGPDEFRDVPRYLDPLLSSTPAVGSKRSWSAPNVTYLLEFQTEERTFPRCGDVQISTVTGRFANVSVRQRLVH